MKKCWNCNKSVRKEYAIKGEEEFWPQKDYQDWEECKEKTICVDSYFGTYCKAFCSNNCLVAYKL